MPPREPLAVTSSTSLIQFSVATHAAPSYIGCHPRLRAFTLERELGGGNASRIPMPDTPSHFRARLVYVAFAGVTIALGLAVHLYGAFLGSTLRDMTGDALWAAMIVWWIAAIAPVLSISARSAIAIAICFAVEFSQLYHTQSLDALRAGIIGHLVLGSGFDPRDLLSYTIGVLAAAAFERLTRSPRAASV